MQDFGRSTMDDRVASLRINARLRSSIPFGSSRDFGGGGNGNNDTSNPVSSVLQERLEEVLVLELLKDGGRNYLTLSVRSLYKHVLKAITTPPSNLQTVDENRTAEETPTNMEPNSEEKNDNGGGNDEYNSSGDYDVNQSTDQDEQQEDPMLEPLPPPLVPLSTIEEVLSTGSPTTTTNVDPPASFLTEPPRNPEMEITFGETTSTPPIANLPKPKNSTSNSPSKPASFASPSSAKPVISMSSSPLQASLGSVASKRSQARHKSISLFSTSQKTNDADDDNPTEPVTYRERLGGYLHPRDMRRLVTPFSTSNEPDLIVRRHVMLLNFDPLRTIILRDRLLVLIPDGADSLLVDLERRVRGGNKELESVIFGLGNSTVDGRASSGKDDDLDQQSTISQQSHSATVATSVAGKPPKQSIFSRVLKSGRSSGGHSLNDDDASMQDHDGSDSASQHSRPNTFQRLQQHIHSKNEKVRRIPSREDLLDKPTGSLGGDDRGTEDTFLDDENMFHNADEWDDIKGQEWVQLPFELQCADAVLQTVVGILSQDTYELEEATLRYIDGIINGHRRKEDPLTIIRAVKDAVRQMTARVKSFVQSMTTILDDYEDMALMNLSRLITNPDRFIQPVPAEVLEEESDEPELILESYLQQSLSLTNVLDLIQGQIDTAAELVDQKLDATRNKILLANTIITTVALSVDCAMLVSAFFGMNLTNHLEDSDDAFNKVVAWTLAASVVLFMAVMSIMYRTGTIPGWGSVDI